MKTRNGTKKTQQIRGVVADWKPLFARLEGTAEWALDLAARLAGDYDEDIEAIERVRSYLHGWLAGRRIDLDLNDLLTTLGILFAAIEIDRDVEPAPWLDPSYAGQREPMRFPGGPYADHTTIAIVPVRRRIRNAAAPSQLAA